MSGLVDPSRLVIVRSTHEAGGVVLHESADCPQDSSCPVWVAWHREAEARPMDARAAAEHVLSQGADSSNAVVHALHALELDEETFNVAWGIAARRLVELGLV